MIKDGEPITFPRRRPHSASARSTSSTTTRSCAAGSSTCAPSSRKAGGGTRRCRVEQQQRRPRADRTACGAAPPPPRRGRRTPSSACGRARREPRTATAARTEKQLTAGADSWSVDDVGPPRARRPGHRARLRPGRQLLLQAQPSSQRNAAEDCSDPRIAQARVSWSVRVAGVLFSRDARSPCSWCPLAPGAGGFDAGGGVRCASVAVLPRVRVGRGSRVAADGALVSAFGGAVDRRCWSRWRLAGFCGRWGARWRAAVPASVRGFVPGAVGCLCSASLVAIFATQEFLEGLLATGIRRDWSGIFGFGGWWSIPAPAVCWSGAGGGVPRRPVGP